MNQRQTGRTSRMFSEAVSLASEGKYVFVVVADRDMKRRHLQLVTDHAARRVCEGKFKVGDAGGCVVFYPMSGPLVDRERLSMIGAHPSCVTLVDHHAIEQHFGAVLAMLHRWDSPEKASSGKA